MNNIGDSPKDWQRVVGFVQQQPASTAPEIAKLLGKSANTALYAALRKRLLTRTRVKGRSKRYPYIGSWVYEVKLDAQ